MSRCLLDVRLGPSSIGIKPTSTALGAANRSQPAHNEITFVLGNPAPAAVLVIPRFGADPDSVEIGSLTHDFVAAVMKVVVPLRVLYDEFFLRIYAFRPTNDPFT